MKKYRIVRFGPEDSYQTTDLLDGAVVVAPDFFCEVPLTQHEKGFYFGSAVVISLTQQRTTGDVWIPGDIVFFAEVYLEEVK